MSKPARNRVGQELAKIDGDRRLPWHDDPVVFARTCIDWPEGSELSDYQAEILATLAAQSRVATRSPHGTGKSATAAITVLWFALSRDATGRSWKALTTAGSWRQLTAFLWPEIRTWARRLRWDVIGRQPFDERNELLQLELKLRHGSAFAAASDNPALLEGMHAESLLAIFDESKAITPAVFDALEGAFASPGEVFALAISTPGAPSGRFYQFFQRAPGLEDWIPMHVTLEQAIAAGRIPRAWAEQRAKQWGADSALYKNRVLGEFADGDEEGTIPLSWVEAAIERFDPAAAHGRVTVVGVDVARSGADKSVLALRCGDVLSELRAYTTADTMILVGHVAGVLRANPGCRAVVDVIGVGGGPVDRLREQGFKNTVAFNASARSDRKDASGELGFANARAAAWWNMRELLDPANGSVIALPPDDLLIGDLTAPKFQVNSSGKLQIESKDEIRKRLGRSTDHGDACVQAFFEEAKGEGSAWMEYMQAMADTGGDTKAARRLIEANRNPPPTPVEEVEYEVVETPPCERSDCTWRPSSEHPGYDECTQPDCDEFREQETT